MHEAEVNHRIRGGCAFAHAVEIFERAAQNLRAESSDGAGPLIRTSHPENLMSGADQLLDEGSADKAGGTSDKHAHEQVSEVSLETNLGHRAIMLK